MLDRALRQDKLTDMLDGLSPQHLGYLALKAALPQSGGQFETLVANMERWRWLPPVLEADRIMVNAADSQLELWLAGRLVLTSRVIVGRVSNPTPILRAEGGAITINPSWTVPRSIAAREILPKLKKNPAWLAQHDMVLLDGPAGDPHGRTVNWGAVRANTFPYQIRQRPGPHNPLGRIKLELPNRFDVYLHDTPDKALFNRFKRQLSHGCVRVEQIMPVTTHVLSADPTAISRVTMAMEKGETVTIPLQSRIPVYFLYWTATAAPGEALQYHPDVYGRDRRMIAAMRGRQMRVASAGPACPKG
jgi:murein L,D-transpeptidase YcbB/YkuD